MKRTNHNALPTRRLTVRRSGTSDAANELQVSCPLTRAEVLLQRCAFCEHGHGLLLDPATNSLRLKCSFPEPAHDKPRSLPDEAALQID